MSTTTSDSIRDVFTTELLPEQVHLLRSESREFTVASVFAAIMATLALWRSVPQDTLTVWLFCTAGWSLLREAFMHLYADRLPQRMLPAALILATAVAGVTWAALTVAFFNPQHALTAVFVTLVVVSMSLVSLVWLSAWSPVYFAFALPALLSVVWVLFAARYLVAGVLALTVVSVALYLAYKIERAVRHRAALQGRNDSLTDRFQAHGSGMREARLVAERATSAKAEFLAAAGIDLRQRLDAMNLLIDSLRASDQQVERESAINRVDEAFRSLDSAFESLLDVARLEEERIHSDLQSFHLRDVTTPLCGSAATQAENKGLSFRTRVRDAVLRSDPRLLQRVTRHLLNNALQHTTSGGVLLATRVRPAEVWLEVWDTGPGISDTELSNVFQEYYKIERSDGGRSAGLGLGLTIVQRLCALLNHPLEVRSRPGRGSRFRVRIPRGSPRALRDSVFGTEYADDVHLEGNTILILDAKRGMLEALEPVLRRWGCAVWPALSGEEALSLVQMEAVRPDAIICDHQLRGEESGFDVVSALRGYLGDRIPVIMTATDSLDADVLARARETRVELLYKPVHPGELRSTLLRLLIEAAEGAPQRGTLVDRQADG